MMATTISERARRDTEWELPHAVMLEAASSPSGVSGSLVPTNIPGKQRRVHRRPAGVLGIISPWNFPTHLSSPAPRIRVQHEPPGYRC
jgi:acyl-CoA reductase-like NAD-dependent aldehyde dehydrogenase